MNNLLRLNNKGVSVMIGYVLLISIAVALSTAVFFYLKLYLPDERPDCYQDINLVIDGASCKKDSPNPGVSTVYINFTNKGLFTVDGAFIKIGDYDRIFRETLNKPEEGLMSRCKNNNNLSLKPGEMFCRSYTYNNPLPGKLQEISVQPFIWIENKAVICPEAIVSRKIMCA